MPHNRGMERRIIPPGFVHDALSCLPSEAAAVEVLRKAGLPDVITGPVTSDEFGAVWWGIADAMDDEMFGLAARPMRRGAFALLCQAVMQSRTLDQALRQIMTFLRVAIEEPHGELIVQSGEARIVLTDPEGPRSAFAYRTYWLFVMGVASWLVGRQIPLRRLEFACEPPARLAEYSQFFGAHSSYGAEATLLVFNSKYLRWPVVRNEKALRSFLAQTPGNLVVRYRHEQGLGLRIRERLNALPPSDWPGIEEFATEFHMSSATLRRRLSAEGRSIGGIKDEIRQIRARRYLAAGEMTVAEIAAELGYSEPSAFHRAHRKWTGRSPRGD